MSLNWDLTKINNREELCWKEDEHGNFNVSGVTETLIYCTMFVGMHTITAQNAEKFYTRVSLFEKTSGAIRTKWEEKERTDIFVSPEEVLLHVGLSTNVSNLTDAEFKNRMIKNANQKAVSAFTYYVNSLDKVEENV